MGVPKDRALKFAFRVGFSSALSTLFVSIPALSAVFLNAEWITITVVVVVFHNEFLGESIAKSVNRGLGTLLGASLGLAFGHLITLPALSRAASGVLLFALVFLVLGATVFAHATHKDRIAQFDYAVVLFAVTFGIIISLFFSDESSSSTDVVVLAAYRVVDIAVGIGIGLTSTVLIFPLRIVDGVSESLQRDVTLIEHAIDEIFDARIKGLQLARYFATAPENGTATDVRGVYAPLLARLHNNVNVLKKARWEPRRLPYDCWSETPVFTVETRMALYGEMSLRLHRIFITVIALDAHLRYYPPMVVESDELVNALDELRLALITTMREISALVFTPYSTHVTTVDLKHQLAQTLRQVEAAIVRAHKLFSRYTAERVKRILAHEANFFFETPFNIDVVHGDSVADSIVDGAPLQSVYRLSFLKLFLGLTTQLGVQLIRLLDILSMSVAKRKTEAGEPALKGT